MEKRRLVFGFTGLVTCFTVWAATWLFVKLPDDPVPELRGEIPTHIFYNARSGTLHRDYNLPYASWNVDLTLNGVKVVKGVPEDQEPADFAGTDFVAGDGTVIGVREQSGTRVMDTTVPLNAAQRFWQAIAQRFR